MKAEKSIQGMEQLIYPQYSALNSAPGGYVLHRATTRAHQIMRHLAYAHLQPESMPESKSKPKPKRPKAKPKPLPKPDLSETDSHSEMCFVPDSNDYWDSDLECEEFNPALWHDLAVVALKYYHEKQGVELGLNGGISAFPLHYGGGVGFHLAFQANDSTGSPKKIFAEVFRFEKNGECRVLFCDIMDPNDPDLLKGCRFCSPSVLHPKGIKFFKRPYEWSDASV